MADKAHQLTDKKIEQMEKHLTKIYAQEQNDVQKKMLYYAKNIDKESSRLLSVIKEALTEEETKSAKNAYLQYFKNVIKSKDFKDMSAEIASDLFDTNIKATSYINSQTPEIYALNYNWINERLSEDIPDYISQKITAKEADEYGELTKQTVSKSKDTKWNEQNIKKSVIVGAALFLSANAIMKRTAKLTVKKNHDTANTHCSGMITDAENKARLDGMYRAEDMGNDITKGWIATLDNRTRDSHASLDNVYIPLDMTFDNGCDRPRDPNGALSEICNCRCTLYYGVGQRKGETRASRYGDVTGSYKKSSSYKDTYTEEIANMSYKEWIKWRKTR